MSDAPENNSTNIPPILQFIGKILASPFIALFNKIDRYVATAGIVYHYQQDYMSGKLSPDSKAYKKYQNAVIENKIGEKRFKKLLKVYGTYLRKKDHPDFLHEDIIANLFFAPENYVVYTTSDYQKKLEAIKQDFQKQLEEEKEAFKESLIKKLLPFSSSDQEEQQLTDALKQRDIGYPSM